MMPITMVVTGFLFFGVDHRLVAADKYGLNDCGKLSLGNSRVYWSSEVNQPFDSTKTELFPEGLKPLLFEQRIAELSNLPVEEVGGLIRNFTSTPKETWIFDNSFGLFLDRRGSVFEVAGDTNLINSYKWALKNLKLGQITRQQIVRMRELAIQELHLENGTTIVRPDSLEYKNESDVMTLKSKIHPEVAAKLEAFGYKVRPVGEGAIELAYSNEVTTPEQRLDRFVMQLNMMHANQRSPKEVAAFAAQELNLIHTFRDGNGRTSRLLGQVIYKMLTGKTIIFPEAFHKEMDYSYADLVRTLQ